MDALRALTLHRPWAYAIISLGKNVENRSWRPPKDAVGRPLFIHAGKKWDERGAAFLRVMMRRTDS